MTESEPDLLARALAGDEAAFARLIAPLEPGLRSFLGGRLRHRTDVEVDDALQEVRIYLFRRLDRYLPEYPLAAFAHGLANNIVRRILHRRSDLLPADHDADSSPDEFLPGDLDAASPAFQAVFGKDRFEVPGDPGPSGEFLELFELFLRYGGYPHQQVSFGYSILIWGRSKEPARGGADRSPGKRKVPITGDADRVVTEIGPEHLRASSDGLVIDLQTALRLDSEWVAHVRGPLDHRLDLSIEALFARDTTSGNLFRHLAGCVVGETRLKDYFGADGRQSVTDWTRAVKDRIRRLVTDPSAAAYSLLPMGDGGGQNR